MRRRVIAAVTVEESGSALIDLLVHRYRFKNRQDWLAVAADRKVFVNGCTAEALQILHSGDEVLYEAPEAPEPPVDKKFSVLFEDEQILALNKPGNLPCHPSGCYYENTLLYQIKEKLGLTRVHLINRLDRETSGVILAAKTEVAARNLSDQFVHRRVKKVYSVIVEGCFPDEIEAAGWLIRDENSPVRKKRRFVKGSLGGKPCEGAEWAQSGFNKIESYAELSLLCVKPQTGRLHQIRATLCSLGFPVVGDKLYGVDDHLFIQFINDQLSDLDKLRLRMNRQALHASELEVNHPATGDAVMFRAPLPEDMRLLLKGFSG